MTTATAPPRPPGSPPGHPPGDAAHVRCAVGARCARRADLSGSSATNSVPDVGGRAGTRLARFVRCRLRPAVTTTCRRRRRRVARVAVRCRRATDRARKRHASRCAPTHSTSSADPPTVRPRIPPATPTIPMLTTGRPATPTRSSGRSATGRITTGHLDAIGGRHATPRRRRPRRVPPSISTICSPQRLSSESSVFARRCRALAQRIVAARPASDADELDRQRKNSVVKRWVNKITGMHHTNLELDPIRDAAVVERRQRPLTSMRPGRRQRQHPVDADAGRRLRRRRHAGRSAGGSVEHRMAVTRTRMHRPARPADVAHATARARDHRPDRPTDAGQRVARPRHLRNRQRRAAAGVDGATAVLRRRDHPDGARHRRRAARRRPIRSQRHPHQRRALRAMYRTCAHPDCTMPFSACKAHHIRWWWRDLGPTDLDNLIPLMRDSIITSCTKAAGPSR